MVVGLFVYKSFGLYYNITYYNIKKHKIYKITCIYSPIIGVNMSKRA